MITRKSFTFSQTISWSIHHIIWLVTGATVFAVGYRFDIISLEIPWLPVSVIGTAVAFYVGFKNNQAYDRMWEARKIWGGIINNSRSWGMLVDGFVSGQFTKEKISEQELRAIKRRLIYRHIGWLYAHRSQLLIPAEWEHIKQSGLVRRYANRMVRKFGVGLFNDEITAIELKHYLPSDEFDGLINAQNTATQIINTQSRELTRLRERGIIEDFRHMEMANTLKQFYELQGKNERIKKFPLPRQYANLSRIFVGIFIFLIPFSLIPTMIEFGPWGFWLSIPTAALVGWVYVMMEVIGDYSENPFMGMSNDIPMLSLCRTIEIDLREMLGETKLPPPIQAKNGVLM
ncbi:MAG TPA: hypothetical protein DDX92_00345 [Flavobacteriales bacterium]|jgi:putative membrane protein|nr:hypothetical protein [Flavobacteriales bacterium]